MEDRISENGSKNKIIYIAVTLQFSVWAAAVLQTVWRPRVVSAAEANSMVCDTRCKEFWTF